MALLLAFTGMLVNQFWIAIQCFYGLVDARAIMMGLAGGGFTYNGWTYGQVAAATSWLPLVYGVVLRALDLRQTATGRSIEMDSMYQ